MSALPTPRLSATVYPPPNKGAAGRVVVTQGFRAAVPAAVVLEAHTAREAGYSRIRCTICNVVGHARSNRKFHPRRG